MFTLKPADYKKIGYKYNQNALCELDCLNAGMNTCK